MKQLLITIISVLIVYSSTGQKSINEYIESGKKNMEEKKTKEAINDFTSAIELDSENEYAYAFRALCWMALGKWQLAIPDSDKAININPNQAVAYFVRGCAKCNIKKNGCSDLKKSLSLGFEMARMGLNQFCN